MIELVFVIVVLGILSAVAIPKFSATRVDAEIVKARSDVASVRSAIITERQTRLIRGDSRFINKLHSSDTRFFDNNGSTENSLLMYGVKAVAKDAHWQPKPTQIDNTIDKEVWVYVFQLQNRDNNFTYRQENGTFSCTSGDYCSKLVD